MRRFVLQIILATLPCIFLYTYYRLTISDKPKGDLSRLSYVEFHYNKPKPATTDTLGECIFMSKLQLTHSKKKGIVIFGDSFSIEKADNLWTKYLGGFMGRPIRSVSLSGTNSFLEYLTVLQNAPGCLSDTVIIEMCERYLISCLCGIDITASTSLETGSPKTQSNKERHIGQTPGGFYKTRFLNLIHECHIAPLSDTLFSDHPTTLFYYHADNANPPSNMEIQTAVNNLERLDSLSRSKGIFFVVIPMPNKLTLYKPYITDTNLFGKCLLESPTPFDSIPCFANPLPALRMLTDNGIKDVYLPDDTHSSPIAGKVIAKYLVGFLRH